MKESLKEENVKKELLEDITKSILLVFGNEIYYAYKKNCGKNIYESLLKKIKEGPRSLLDGTIFKLYIENSKWSCLSKKELKPYLLTSIKTLKTKTSKLSET